MSKLRTSICWVVKLKNGFVPRVVADTIWDALQLVQLQGFPLEDVSSIENKGEVTLELEEKD